MLLAGLGLLGFAGSLYYTSDERRKAKESQPEKEWVENYEKTLQNPFDSKEEEEKVVIEEKEELKTIKELEEEEMNLSKETTTTPTIIIHSLQDEETEEQKKERKKQEDKEEENELKNTVYFDLMDKEITNLKKRISIQINSIEQLTTLKEKLIKENKEKDLRIETLETYQKDNEKEIHILINKVEELESNLKNQIEKDILELNQKLNEQKIELNEISDLKLNDLKKEYESIFENLMSEMNDKINQEVTKQKEISDKKYFEKVKNFY